jgi:hypothetical protein
MNEVLRITPHPIVIKLLDKVIHTAEPLNIPQYNIVTKKDFLDIPIPSIDTPKDLSYIAGTLTGFSTRYLVAAKTILKAQHVRNYRYSYPESCLDWHTDSDFVGTRLYYTYTEEEAIFKYSSNNSIQLDYDAVGAWTCRSFNIVSDKLLWHSSWNKGLRYVFGFSI